MSYSYDIPKDLTFENLGEFIRPILQSYQLGEIDRGHLTEWSNLIGDYLWEKYGDPEKPIFPEFAEDSTLSIPIEIVWRMYTFKREGLCMLPSDVPHFLEFLDTPRGQEKEGWRKIREYIAGLKVEDRIKEEEKQRMHRQRSVSNNSV
jgi:hypothetical protein